MENKLNSMLDQARHEATQIERKTLETAVRTLLENEYGAALNVVRDDYPEFAELVDLRLKQAKREAFLEAAKVCDEHSKNYQEWADAHSNPTLQKHSELEAAASDICAVAIRKLAEEAEG